MTTPIPLPPEQLGTPAPASGANRRFRLPKGLIAAVAVVGLSGVVAIASRGAPVWTSLRGAPANRTEILTNAAVVAGAGLLAAFAATLIIHRTLIESRPGAPPLRTTLQRALPITSVALAALVLLTIGRSDLSRTIDGASGDGPIGVAGPEGERRPTGTIKDGRRGVLAGEDRRPDPNGSGDGSGSAPLGPKLLLVLGVVAAAVAGAMYRLSYARRSAQPEPRRDDEKANGDPDLEPLNVAVAGTIDSMLAESDPKTAILGAYARLLEGLAACGLARRDHEAPLEHLHRALTILPIRREPVRQLIGLFELARFSTHRLTPAHRAQALEGLRAAAADLAAVPRPHGKATGSPPIRASP